MANQGMRRMAGCLVFSLAMFFCVPAPAAETRRLTTQANCIAEVAVTSEKTYANPFAEVTLDALITGPDGRQLKVPAFWAGGNEWRCQVAAAIV